MKAVTARALLHRVGVRARGQFLGQALGPTSHDVQACLVWTVLYRRGGPVKDHLLRVRLVIERPRLSSGGGGHPGCGKRKPVVTHGSTQQVVVVRRGHERQGGIKDV